MNISKLFFSFLLLTNVLLLDINLVAAPTRLSDSTFNSERDEDSDGVLSDEESKKIVRSTRRSIKTAAADDKNLRAADSDDESGIEFDGESNYASDDELDPLINGLVSGILPDESPDDLARKLKSVEKLSKISGLEKILKKGFTKKNIAILVFSGAALFGVKTYAGTERGKRIRDYAFRFFQDFKSYIPASLKNMFKTDTEDGLNPLDLGQESPVGLVVDSGSPESVLSATPISESSFPAAVNDSVQSADIRIRSFISKLDPEMYERVPKLYKLIPKVLSNPLWLNSEWVAKNKTEDNEDIILAKLLGVLTTQQKEEIGIVIA